MIDSQPRVITINQEVRVPLLCSARKAPRVVKVANMPGVDFQAVRSAVSMAQVLDLLGFVPQAASGKQRRGPCPVHRSSSPESRSFSANLEKNTFQRFKCGASGNHLDLWAAVNKVNVYDAAIDLCGKLNQAVPWLHRR